MFSNNLIAGAAGQPTGFYPLNIEQSLRFNDDDSAYLSRTPASAGNRKTWTWSGWVKRGNITAGRLLSEVNNTAFIEWSDTLTFRFLKSGANEYELTTTQVFRDPSAWYHIVCVADSTQATDTDRMKIYVNGDQVTALSTANYVPQNTDSSINDATSHQIGSLVNGSFPSGVAFLDGYLAEVHFVDGTAYDADAFGEFKSGVWVAKSPSVTYGTNGFYLDFANSADIGNDVSGEGNDWTPNNFTASDVVLDSPTDNYAVMNPLQVATSGAPTFADGNLQVTTPVSGSGNAVSTIGVTSGKYYAEVKIVSLDTLQRSNVGITGDAGGTIAANTNIGSLTSGLDVGYFYDGKSFTNNVETSGYGSSYDVGDLIGIALNVDDSEVTFYKNNVSQGAISFNTGGTYHFAVGDVSAGGGGTVLANFGQLGFTYTPPTGYLALSTANLPEPTISPADDASPSDYFNTVLYTGNGSTQSITGIGFQPDFVWLKRRNTSGNNGVYNSVVGGGKFLVTNLTDAENSGGGVSTFDSDGFSFSNNFFNDSGDSFVAWNWKANGSGVSNTDGTITSTVSANTTSGFSIVSWVGTESTDTVGHGLDSAPEMIMVKNRDDSGPFWRVFHVTLGAQNYLALNATDASASASTVFPTAPTSTVFGVGADNAHNGSNDDMIAYCFHSVEGFSKFGSYTGNGSADGSFIYCGFRPAFIMIKCTSGTSNWLIRDVKRDTYNQSVTPLAPNLSAAESSFSVTLNETDILSNGFKLRDDYGDQNGSGQSYIFAAFAEQPFRYANAR